MQSGMLWPARDGSLATTLFTWSAGGQPFFGQELIGPVLVVLVELWGQ